MRERTDREESLTGFFAAVQAPFWMNVCVAVAFAAVYLQGLGYSNWELGIVMAAGNLLGTILGPLVSSRIDRDARITAAGCMPPALIVMAASLVGLLLFPGRGMITSVCYAVYISLYVLIYSLHLKIYTDVTYAGGQINYGVARGIGSLSYVIASLVLGALTARTSIRAIPVAGMVLCAAQVLTFANFLAHTPKHLLASSAEQKRGVSIAQFLRKYKRFGILLLGTALIFASYNIIANFMINVAKNVGGGTGTMGFISGFMAAVEIPVMLLFTRLFGKRNTGALLRFAFVFFTIRGAAIAAATTVPLLTAALLLQAPSYAIYTAAIVPYVICVIPHEDTAKAQSLAFSMSTFSAVVAGPLGGWLYDRIPVTTVLWIACAICAAGTVISLIGTKEKSR